MRPPQAGDRINNYLLDERIAAGGPDLKDMTPARVRVTGFGLGRFSQVLPRRGEGEAP